MTPRSMAGRRALVTGASRGIGAGIAERLAAEGADVAITARTLDRHAHLAGSLQETAGRLRRHGRRVEVLVCDLADPGARVDLVGRAAESLGGPVDVLVNNAAAAIYQPLADYPLHRARLTFEVNVLAPLDLAQQAAPGMRTAGAGWIVNLSSAAAAPRPGPPYESASPGTTLAVYGASKAALGRLTNGLAAELHGSGIRVNTVAPRFGVLSEGAAALVGRHYEPERFETLEEMVEATLALCAAPEDLTGRTCISLDLIRELDLLVRGLDGRVPAGNEETA